MIFCGNCGAQVPDGVKFCPGCGQAVGEAQSAPAQPVYQAPPQPEYQQQYQQPVYQAPPPQPEYQQQYQQPPQYPPQYPPQQQYAQQGYAPPVVPGAPGYDAVRDAQDNKVMAILSYLIFFIPLLTGDHKKSPFVKFHVNQGTLLFIASIALSIVVTILNIIPFFILFSWLFYFVPTIFCILGIVNAAKGEMKELPIIGKLFVIIK